jgi:hypothetical protein
VLPNLASIGTALVLAMNDDTSENLVVNGAVAATKFDVNPVACIAVFNPRPAITYEKGFDFTGAIFNAFSLVPDKK